jgi:hypothetical protein
LFCPAQIQRTAAVKWIHHVTLQGKLKWGNMHGCDWFHVPRIKNIKRRNMRGVLEWGRHWVNEKYMIDELLVDLWNDHVGLSGGRRSSFQNFF